MIACSAEGNGPSGLTQNAFPNKKFARDAQKRGNMQRPKSGHCASPSRAGLGNVNYESGSIKKVLSQEIHCLPHSNALEEAKKARTEKIRSKYTFSHQDPKYYSRLPVQPATGWWKSVLSLRRQSPAFINRLCKSLQVLIPDTVFVSPTDCYYVSNNPAALATTLRDDHQLSFPDDATNGWSIISNFTATKLFERNIALYAASAGFGNGALRGPATLPRSKSGRKAPESALVVPAAVMKQAHYAIANKNISKAMDLGSLTAMSTDTSQEKILQAFVHGRPWARCQLTRAAWRSSRHPLGFVFVNKLTPREANALNADMSSQFLVSLDGTLPNPRDRRADTDGWDESGKQAESSKNSNPLSATFDVHALSGGMLAEAADIARNIMLFTQTAFKLWIDSMAVDLIKAANGKWYFLQVKAFTLKESSPSTDTILLRGPPEETDDEKRASTSIKSQCLLKQQITMGPPSVCAMCGVARSKKSINRVMTPRMMLEAQHHMRKRGVDILYFHQTNRQSLSAKCLVCGICYSLYLVEKELIKLEMEMAEETGTHTGYSEDTFFLFSGILDAIQSSTQPHDAYLRDLLSTFENANGASAENDITAKEQAWSTPNRVVNPPPTPPSEEDPLIALAAAGRAYDDDSLSSGNPESTSKTSRNSRAPQDVPAKTAHGALVIFQGGEAVRTEPRPISAGGSLRGARGLGNLGFASLPACLYQWRLMIFVQTLHDPPANPGTEHTESAPFNHQLILRVLGQTATVPLPQPSDDNVVSIKKLLIFYFFSSKPSLKDIFKDDLYAQLLPGQQPYQRSWRAKSAGYRRPHSSGVGSTRIEISTGALVSEGEKPLHGNSGAASGSCSLYHLAMKKSVKSPRTILLFSEECACSNKGYQSSVECTPGTTEGEKKRQSKTCSLQVVVGVNRDCSVPTQYTNVKPLHDGFIPAAPYSSTRPLPQEWIDCLVNPTP